MQQYLQVSGHKKLANTEAWQYPGVFDIRRRETRAIYTWGRGTQVRRIRNWGGNHSGGSQVPETRGKRELQNKTGSSGSFPNIFYKIFGWDSGGRSHCLIWLSTYVCTDDWWQNRSQAGWFCWSCRQSNIRSHISKYFWPLLKRVHRILRLFCYELVS